MHEEGRAPAATGSPEIEAKQLQREGSMLHLTGDARVRVGERLARAAEMRVDEEAGQIVLEGEVRYSDARGVLEASRAEWSGDRLQADEVRYRLDSGQVGQAERLTRTESGTLVITDGTYSTCTLSDPSWQMEAAHVELDPSAGQGEAHHVVLRIAGVPVVTVPWISFPIGDARKSGWLLPTVGAESDNGFSLDVPYYFNLAPNYDATAAVRYMGRRGLMLRGTTRYLTAYGEGTVEGEYVKDQEERDDRYRLHWHQRADRPNGWDYRIRYTQVSDPDYVDDFNEGRSETRLRQEAVLAWRSLDWQFEAGVHGSEALKNHTEQWDRLPRVRGSGRVALPGGVQLRPQVAADVFRGGRTFTDFPSSINFAFNNNAPADQVSVSGERYDFALALERPVTGQGWQVLPRLNYRYTYYDLSYIGHQGTGQNRETRESDEQPTRTQPEFSLDAQMQFERLSDGGLVQTLEPHLFYLNRPHRDEEHLPKFDTRAFEPDYAAMFRANAYSGFDRRPAADQLAVGMRTRVIDPVDGYVKVLAQLARVYYFRTPGRLYDVAEPTLEGNSTHSAYLAELEFHPDRQWTLRSTVRYDAGRQGSDTAHLSHLVRYRASGRQQLQARYTRRAGELEQASAHLLWPLSDNWHLAGHYSYDLREGRDLEILVALEYRTCCMTLGVGLYKEQESVLIAGGERHYNKGVMLQLQLHGLAGFGEDFIGQVRSDLDYGHSAWPQ